MTDWAHAIAKRIEQLTSSDVLVTRINEEGAPCCYYCGKEIKQRGHWDHVFPRARGGSNSTFNLVYACARCNIEKTDKFALDWILVRERHFPEHMQIDLIARLLLATREAHAQFQRRTILHVLLARLLRRLLEEAEETEEWFHIDCRLNADKIRALLAALEPLD